MNMLIRQTCGYAGDRDKTRVIRSDEETRFTALRAEFEEQLKEEERLNKVILENLSKIKID